MHQRTCPVDGTVFETSSHNRRYCSKRCKKRADNAKRGGWEPSSRPMPAPFTCQECGKRCTPGENVVPHASAFCAAECKVAWHKRREGVIASLTAPMRRMDEVVYRRAMRRDPCSYCDASAVALDHIEPKCSGGDDDWSNRTGACHSCNSTKQSSPLLIYLGWQQARAAFEPWRAIVAAIHTRTPAA